jgi:hypothetical protein
MMRSVFTHLLIPTGAAGQQDPLFKPATQQGEADAPQAHAWIEAAYGCVDWYLYPKDVREGAG